MCCRIFNMNMLFDGNVATCMHMFNLQRKHHWFINISFAHQFQLMNLWMNILTVLIRSEQCITIETIMFLLCKSNVCCLLMWCCCCVGHMICSKHHRLQTTCSIKCAFPLVVFSMIFSNFMMPMLVIVIVSHSFLSRHIQQPHGHPTCVLHPFVSTMTNVFMCTHINLMKNMKTQIIENQWQLNKINTKNPIYIYV